MSSSSKLEPDFRDFGVIPHMAEIAGFHTIKEADEIAASLKAAIAPGSGYAVLTFAAGMYYVVLVANPPAE